jgi:hypothetical protein
MNGHWARSNSRKSKPLTPNGCIACVRACRSPGDSELAADLFSGVAVTLLRRGKFVGAEPLARECFAIREQAHPDDWRTYKTHSLLGAALLGQKRHAEAEPWLRSGYEGLTRHEARIPAASRQRLTEAIQWLVDLYQAVGKSEQTAALKQQLAGLEEAQGSRKALAHSPAESPR